ncbi:hypothetical protein MASR2M41_16850 [Flammeovirgaceae bacterium]
MNKNNMAGIIQDYLNSINQSLSQDQVIALAKQIIQPMWNWHIYLGYVLVGLFTVRFSLSFFGKMKIQSPFDKNLSAKMKFQKWAYIVFYVCVIVSLATGLTMELGPKEFEKPMENIHVLGIYYLITFIVIHLGGVLIAEFTDQKGIISRIIGGSKE